MLAPGLRSICSVAWRDLRASGFSTLYIVAAIAVSAGVVSGVRGAETGARRALENSSREWLAADISVHCKDPITETQTAALDRLRQRGIQWTVVTSAVSMVSSDESPDPGFITVKAADPRVYPFYGSIDLTPAQPLETALDPDTVVVSSDVVSRMQVKTGDTIRIAGVPFRISGVIEQEPDRFAGTVSIGMRCILSDQGYDRSAIARGGNTQLYRILLRLPPQADLDVVMQHMEDLFPDGTVLDARDRNRQVASTVETAISALGPAAVKVLVLGVLGVILAVRQHIERRMEMAAVMKFLGGRSWQIGGVFLFQIGVMTAAAFFVSIPLGYAARTTILLETAKFVPVADAIRWDWGSVVESGFATLVATIPAALQPVLMVRRVRPAMILRRDAGETGFPRTWTAPALVSVAVAVAAFAALSAHVSGSWRSGLFVFAATLGNLAGVAILTSAILYLLRFALPKFRPSMLYHGVANLYRPGNRSWMLIVALSAALTSMVGTFEANQEIARSFAGSPTFADNNLFLVGFDHAYRTQLLDALSRQPGVEGPPQVLSLASLRLRGVNGVPLSRDSKAIPRHWLVTCASGAAVAISDDTARLLGVQAGSRIELEGRGRIIPLKIHVIRRFSPVEKVWSSMIVDCDALEGQNLYDYAAARVAPGQVNNVVGAFHALYPAIAVIKAEDLASTALSIARDASSLFRALGWYTVVAGIAVLIASVAASRSGRRREIGILLALGAKLRTVIAIYTTEFAAIGTLAGVIGSVFSYALTSITLFAVFRNWTFNARWQSVAVTVLISATATPGIAWLQCARLFMMKPMDVLRRE